MPIAKIRQLTSYDIPVALFRYNSTYKTFYFDWIKRYAYLSSSSEKKSFNIEFQNHHLWTKDSNSNIISFLESKNKFSRGSFSFPIKGFINNINAPDKTVRKLSAKISSYIELIKISRDRNSADIEINILENRIVLNLSGSFGGSIGYENEDNTNEDLIFNAFKTCLILVLSQTNKDVELFKFINDHKFLDKIIRHSGMLAYLMPKLIASESGKHFTKEIVNHVFKNEDNLNASIIQTIIVLSNSNIISQERVESYFEQIIELNIKSKNNDLLSTSYYNFGGYYRGMYIFDKALYYYKKAYKTNRSYLKRGYFCRELAGILFELRFYQLSKKFYQEAQILEPDNIFLLATLGDAEFFSGNYQKALGHFDNFLLKNNENINDKYEFSLKFTICKSLIEFLEIKSQKRNPKKSFETLESLTKRQLKDSKKIIEIIKIDALNPIVWNYYSIFLLKNENFIMFFLSFLIQGVLLKRNAKIWSHLAILTTYEGAPYDLLNDIVNTAYFYCREDFISEMQDIIELEDYKNFKGNEFLNHVEKVIKNPKEHPMELRFWNDKEFKIIKV